MPSYAVAFLDRFLGGEPNWVLPGKLASRQAMRPALGGSRPRDTALR
jgi:hypothetical protein